MTSQNQNTDSTTDSTQVLPYAMVPPSHLTESTLYITKSALDRLRFLKKQDEKKQLAPSSKPDHFLRISVLSGGCYGFQYKFEFDSEIKKDDCQFSFEDISIVIDDVSYELLQDVTLDYVEELIGAAFTLRNPNSQDSCGCGNSFSI